MSDGKPWKPLLTSLRAAAEPTRLRLLALAARGAFCVMEFTEILGQSQPRLSRHLKLLCEAGLLERVREGANVWFAAAAGRGRVRWPANCSARLPEDDPVLEADRRQAARVLAERARIASESFRRKGADWDEMRALDLPAPAVEAALLTLVPDGQRRPAAGHRHRHRARAGTAGAAGDARAGRGCQQGDAGAGARRGWRGPSWRIARCGWPTCTGCRWPDASFDVAVLQMVLHYAEEPASVAGRGGARAAARRPADRGRSGAARPRPIWRAAGASLAGVLRRRDARAARRGRPDPGRRPLTVPPGRLAVRASGRASPRRRRRRSAAADLLAELARTEGPTT